jgi:hypothetical protein
MNPAMARPERQTNVSGRLSSLEKNQNRHRQQRHGEGALVEAANADVPVGDGQGEGGEGRSKWSIVNCQLSVE